MQGLKPSAAEQVNATIMPVDKTLSYMNIGNFVLFMTIYIAHHNLLRISKLTAENTIPDMTGVLFINIYPQYLKINTFYQVSSI